MSILIEDAHMPPCCAECFCCYDGYCQVSTTVDEFGLPESREVDRRIYRNKRMDFCPLKAFPSNEVIDVEQLLETARKILTDPETFRIFYRIVCWTTNNRKEKIVADAKKDSEKN